MQITSVVRASALVTTVALVGLSASPALAAEPVAKASATGATLSVANAGTSSGIYAVTNDGTKESVSGSNKPPLSLLGNQSLISAGVLAQDAVTRVSDGAGSSAACAGLAGQGASIVAAGSGSCLSGGNALNLTTAQLDLNKIAGTQLVAGQGPTSLTGLLGTLGAAGQLTGLLSTLQSGLDQALAPLAGSGLVLGAGAIQSSCTASQTTADGTANIADASAYVQLPAFAGQPAQRIDLLNLPANPPPNTNVLVNLDAVTKAVIDGVTTSLNTSAASALGQIPGITQLLGALNMTLQTVQDQVVAAAVAQLQPALGPLNQNVLQGTLNKQVRPTGNSIEVTALELNVLPVLQQQVGFSLASTAIGISKCGPSSRVAAPAAAPATKAPVEKKKPSKPRVPTSVPAGLADAPSQDAPLGPWALGGIAALLAASVGAGASAYRRSNARG